MSTALEPVIEYPPVKLARFTVEQYHRMLASGALKESNRFELLDGLVVEKMTKNPLHSIVTGNIHDCLATAVPSSWHIRNQEPISMLESEPEPDLAIIRGKRNDYVDEHPGSEDIALVIEVADATLSADRWKLEIYASAGIRTCWIVNLVQNRVEIYTEPNREARTYQNTRILTASDPLSITLDQKLPLGCSLQDLLPPAK